MPFLPPRQQRQSTEGKKSSISADQNPQQQQKRQEQCNNVSYEFLLCEPWLTNMLSYVVRFHI